MTLSDAGHVSSTRERMVELVKGALIDTDYKVGERERKWEGSEGTVDLVVERTLLQVQSSPLVRSAFCPKLTIQAG